MGRRKKRLAQKALHIDGRRLLQLYRSGTKPLGVGDILHALGLKKRHRGSLVELLESLVEQGKLIRTRGAYGLVERMNLVTGRLQVQRSGVGFVIPDDTRRKDIFISERNLGDAWHGDRVVAAVVRERRGKNHEGRIVRVLERGRTSLSVAVVKRVEAQVYLCRPTEPRMGFAVLAQHDGEKLAPGTLALAVPGDKVDNNLWEAKLVAVLGNEQDVAAQESVTKSNHCVPTTFPDKALAQAQALPREPSQDDLEDRRDLRSMDFVTIDGRTARDFDDAVFVERGRKGYVLWVAIADVSHYVPPFSPLDREAYERGNSYYFPLSVEPMFPEKLSNGLCSLNPGVDRLALGARIEFSAAGDPGAAEFFQAVINSKARLTYGQVKKIVLDQDNEVRGQFQHVVEMLDTAEELARKLTEKRKKRGSLNFDLPEPEVEINDEGRVVSVRPKQMHYAHRIIEEFMVAANEAVARFLTEAGPACLYRIHPEADAEKLTNLYKVLKKTGHAVEMPSQVTPESLQELISQVAGTDLEFLVNRMLLRSMKQARYSPDNEGHFGLASESYCHFTSPIRRYADLVVHRLLKIALGDSSLPVPGTGKLRDMADQLYACERRAMGAEREMDRRVAALYLLDHLGEEFEGVISSIADYGFRVELKEPLAEGMIRLSSLNDDYYAYWKDRELLVGERTGNAFRLGQKVRVRVEDVNLSALEVDLTLASGAVNYKDLI